MSSKVKVKVAEIETTLELFAYWLERDFPRVKELKWLELRAMDDPKANPLFERKWWACVFKFPVLTIVAQTMTPGKVSTAWGLSPFNVGLTDIPHPIEAMGKWVEFRFGVVATSPEEETPANERAMLALRPPGRTRDSWNQRAIDRLLAGEDMDTVRADWRTDFEVGAGTSPDQTTNGEAKTWHMRVWEPYQRSQRSK